jgi:hypothetical protein
MSKVDKSKYQSKILNSIKKVYIPIQKNQRKYKLNWQVF